MSNGLKRVRSRWQLCLVPHFDQFIVEKPPGWLKQIRLPNAVPSIFMAVRRSVAASYFAFDFGNNFLRWLGSCGNRLDGLTQQGVLTRRRILRRAPCAPALR
jgi:hypothetical protein